MRPPDLPFPSIKLCYSTAHDVCYSCSMGLHSQPSRFQMRSTPFPFRLLRAQGFFNGMALLCYHPYFPHHGGGARSGLVGVRTARRLPWPVLQPISLGNGKIYPESPLTDCVEVILFQRHVQV